MERIQPKHLPVPQSGESSAVVMRSATRLDKASRLHIGEMLSQMAAGFPSQEQSPETAQMYQRGVETLVEEYGLPTVQTALESFLTRQKFFPHPSEIREVLEAMATKARNEALVPYVPDPTCNHISQDGMAWVLDKDGDRVMGRCECWKRWKGQQAATTTTTRDHKAAAAGQ